MCWTLGRWFGMDQLSEKFHTASPYAYVMNNPAMLIDPDGRDAMFSSGTEEILNQYMVNTYWKKSSSLVPGYSGSAIFGFSGINAPTQYSSVSRSWTSSLTPGKQTFDFDYLGTDSNGDIVGDYASVVFTGISSLTRWTMETKVWESGILNNIDYASKTTKLGTGFLNWVQNHPREFTSIAGMIQSGSTIAEKGLANWNAASSITKSKVIAETISTKLPVSAKALGTASTVLKGLGTTVGIIGLTNTAYQYSQDNISGTRAVVDGVMGVAGFFPATAWVSLGYFATMAIYETYYNDGKPSF